MLIVLLASALVAGVGIGRAQTFSTLSGSVLDSTNRVIPNVTLTITDPRNGAKHEVTSDGTGHFEFVGLPPGEYRVEAVRPGFANLRDSVVVVGPGVQKNLVLDVGTLLETITVAGTANPAPNDGTGGAPGSSRPARQPSVACEPTAVGGNIRPPVKLLDMRPDYPEALQRAGIEGVVIMNALVGADGLVRDVEVLREANPDLARAAATAVRQWVFSETLLNCEPTDVRLLVTTNFVIRP
jgi:TonB family protein